MYSVTQRIKAITQPRGGYLPIKSFTKKPMHSTNRLNYNENVHPSIIGLTVDYLSRLMLVESPAKAFYVSLVGALILEKEVTELPIDLSDHSIKLAVQLASYDVAVRASPTLYTPSDTPDADTIENIRILTNRVIDYHKDEPITWPGFTFEGGYSDTVVAGDGDWLTKHTLYDLKVLRGEANSKHTLQLLMYWIMGMNSQHKEYQDIKEIALINPRKDITYHKKVSEIDESIIEDVKRDVIGYTK